LAFVERVVEVDWVKLTMLGKRGRMWRDRVGGWEGGETFLRVRDVSNVAIAPIVL
jgi:hypothetical protein